MKKLLALSVAAALLAVIAVPSSAQNPPYKLPPGQYCKDVPKKKLAGHNKTQFAECVTAMAKLDKKPSLTPSQVCEPMKKAKGAKAQKQANKSYKQCLQAGKKLKLDKANS